MKPYRINADEPKAVPGDPVPPPGLDKVGRAAFTAVVEDLRALGCLSRTDSAAIGVYAHTFSRWTAANADIAENGMFVDCDNGNRAMTPAVRVARDTGETLRRLLCEFGMTPAARSRLKAPPGKTDDLASFLDRTKPARKAR
jgi:P27 family predicted phage terminase small subunit